jgi:glycosyltransferase involved in cell wall biosynthesis
MRICFFGIYSPEYSRNKVLLEGCKTYGIDVVLCGVNPRQYKGIKKYWELFKLARTLNRKEIDAVLVAFPGHTVVWLAKLLFWNKKIVFDAFLSLFDSNVYDRKLYAASTLKGLRDWVYDWYSTHLADVVLVDTNAHATYFEKAFNVAHPKLVRILIGADTDVFYPREATARTEYIVHFHGNFIPLQGIEYIIDAALLLKDQGVIIQIVGDGQEGKKIREKVKELGLEKIVRFIGKVSLEEVPKYIAASDITLGIFGDTEKTLRVIPNKVYECVAMAKPVITARTPAILEVFKDNDSLVLTDVADAKDIADKIIYLKNNKQKADEIARNGYALFKEQLLPVTIMKPLIEYLQRSVT